MSDSGPHRAPSFLVSELYLTHALDPRRLGSYPECLAVVPMGCARTIRARSREAATSRL
jgi:hypothetical protein